MHSACPLDDDVELQCETFLFVKFNSGLPLGVAVGSVHLKPKQVNDVTIYHSILDRLQNFVLGILTSTLDQNYRPPRQ